MATQSSTRCRDQKQGCERSAGEAPQPGSCVFLLTQNLESTTRIRLLELAWIFIWGRLLPGPCPNRLYSLIDNIVRGSSAVPGEIHIPRPGMSERHNLAGMSLNELLQGRPVAVIGAGLVGAGWAIVFAQAGLNVRIYDVNPEATKSALALIAEQLKELEGFGLIDDPAAIAALVKPAFQLADAVEGAAYAQESVLERVELKRSLMEELEEVAPFDLVIGSSSSGIPASAFTHGLKIASRVLVVHPVNPPYLVPVVELVPSPDTSPATAEFADALMRGLKRSVVHVRKEVQGFVLNRLQSALLREAWALVEDGVASCEDIDRTMRDGLGWRWSFMGPFETIDLNAQGGVADYANRLGTLCQEIALSRTHQEPWSAELISKVEAERRSVLSQDDLASRRAWRDRRLMALAADRQKETMP
jgi:L-gulonate 3-dehydrogenase